jgi:short subunit dehydrogenase-like uncharacterized protein
MGTGRGPLGAAAAVAVTGGLFAFLTAMAVPPTRALLDRVLPAPGTGPSVTARERGWFRMAVDAGTDERRPLHCRGPGPRRPGIRRDGGDARAERPGPGAGRRAPAGPRRLTDPATALGTVLVDRLRAGGAHLRGDTV